jgi:hypothetical protein
MPYFRKLILVTGMVGILTLAVSLSALAAIEYGSSANGMTNPPGGNASSTLTITRPGNVAAGELLLAQISFRRGSDVRTITPPPAWNLVRRTNYRTNFGQAIYAKIASTSETDTYSWTFSQSVNAAGGILRYTGVDAANPVAASSGNSGDSRTLTASSISTTVVNCRLVAFYGIARRDTQLSTPSGMTRNYLYQNPQDIRIQAVDQLWAASGNTGNRVSTAGNSEYWVAQLIALRPSTVTGNYTLTYLAGDNGSIDGMSTQIVNPGSDGTAVTAVPEAGYSFVNWSDGSTVNPRTDTKVSANITVTASFARNTFTITSSAGLGGSISPAGSVIVNSGESQAFTITPGSSYTVSEVLIDSVSYGPITSYAFVGVAANHTITASFIASPPTSTIPVVPVNPVPLPPSEGLSSSTGSSNRIYLFNYMTGIPGVFSSEFTTKTWDGLMTVVVPEGTRGRTSEGWALSYIGLQPVPQVEQKLAAPERGNIIGLTYKLEPEGATFNPSILITLIYKPELIPDGVNERDLVIGYWDVTKNQWEGLAHCVVDPVTDRITAPANHFSNYTILYLPHEAPVTSPSITGSTTSPLPEETGKTANEPAGTIAGSTAAAPSTVSPGSPAASSTNLKSSVASTQPSSSSPESVKSGSPGLAVILFGVIFTAAIVGGVLMLLRRKTEESQN